MTPVEFAEKQLIPLVEEGSQATFLGVPVGQLSREALLGLVGHLGREQVRAAARAEEERAMHRDILRAITGSA